MEMLAEEGKVSEAQARMDEMNKLKMEKEQVLKVLWSSYFSFSASFSLHPFLREAKPLLVVVPTWIHAFQRTKHIMVPF